MDEKRTAVAVLLSICAILLYSELVMDPYIKRGADARAAAAVAAKAAESASSAPGLTAPHLNQAEGPNLVAGSVAVVPSLAAASASGEVIVQNDSVVAKVSLLGGRFTSYVLKNYQKHFGESAGVELVASLDGAPLPLGVWIGDRSDVNVLYSGSSSPDGRSVVLRGKDIEKGFEITKSISFAPTGYLSSIDIEVAGSSAPLSLEWNHFVSAADGHARLNPVSFTVLGSDNKLTNTLAGAMPTEATQVADPSWIAFGDRYFIATLIPSQLTGKLVGETRSEQRTDGSHLFSVRLGSGAQKVGMRLYAGPKKAEVLAEAQPGLERTIDLGWFSFLAFPLLGGLKILHAALGNWGLAIVALTLVLKALFLPLTKASFASMKAMQALQPEMKAMREKIKDAAVLNQEMLKLYQKHKVNPMGGCLPVLLQVPVFIGLYNVLLNAIELRHAPFALWVQDLSSPEKLMVAGIPIPLMVLILGVSMFFQQYFTPSAGLDPVQRKVMLFMPVILTISFLVYPLPAGLVLYWVVNNTISIVQQVFLKAERRATPYQATAVAGAAMFAFALVLTKL